MTERSALVIGASGFIGSALCLRLLSMGWDVLAYGSSISLDEILESRNRHNVIFYCAGYTSDFLNSPRKTLEAHAGLLSGLIETDIYDSLVYLSSVRIYDGHSIEFGPDYKSRFLIDLDQPRHLFDITKLMGEWLCRHRSRGRARVVRLANVYRDHNDPGGFLPGLLNKALHMERGDRCSIDSAPNLVRDYVHLDDVLDALIAVALDVEVETVNVASGLYVSNKELAQIISDLSGRQLYFDHPPVEGSLIPPLLDISSLRVRFDWKPRALSQALSEWAAMTIGG